MTGLLLGRGGDFMGQGRRQGNVSDGTSFGLDMPGPDLSAEGR